NEISVPESFIFFIAYHTAVSHHAVCGPYGEARLPLSDVDLAHLACELNSGTNPGDLAEKVNSGTNSGDLAEKVNSSTNPGDLAEKVNSGTNLGDLAERVNSGTNPEDLAERVNSGINSGDLAEKVNSCMNLKDLAEKVNSGMNPGDLTEKMNSMSSRPPSSVDARVLRDLEVMKADHDLDTTVTEGSLIVIRGRYSIPAEYMLHAPRPGQRPYSSDAPGMCITVDALEADLWFPLHPLIEECLRWWRISPSQVAPNSWRYLVVFLGECRGAGIIPTRDLFMAYFRLYKSRGGYYLTTRVDRMDLGDLCGMPKMSSGNAPSTRAAAPAREVDVSPTREALKTSSKRPINALIRQTNDPAQRHEKVKVLTRRHKSRHGEGESRSHSKDKKPVAPSEEPDTPVESNEGGVSPIEGVEELDESLERLVGRRGVREGTSPPSAGAGAIHAPFGGLAGPSCQGNGFGKFPTFVSISQLQQELDTLKSSGGPEAVTKAEERASELGQELEKTKRERDEALLRLEASEKDLSKIWSNLAKVQRLLKEVRVRARKMDDELLQAVKALKNARTELPRQAIVQYKESAGFKEGLNRMGRVTYEYGYRVVLARFHARHPDSEVEEDPFTIHPEDDLVPMERQQAFDDSDPPDP
ncbi:hypothetical protein BHE74_00049581, partial [Ensete ventricosum]